MLASGNLKSLLLTSALVGALLTGRGAEAAGGGGNGTDGHHDEVLAPLYFFFTSLIFGALTLYIQRKYLYFVPYQALLFVEGFLLGILNEGTHHKLGDLSTSIAQWISIDGHLLAAVFLPALIFSDAMRVNIHMFKVIFWQVALMSSVGVGLQCMGVAFVAKNLYSQYGYEWDWYLAFTFGAVLAATDPVAVVAMLEAVQAPAKLTTLMSGESHLSDLTALLIFNVMLSLSTGTQKSQDDLVKYVVGMLLGGPAMGLAWGIGGLIIIRLNTAKDRVQDVMIQLTITVCMAYMSFIVSENNANGNGVLATVTCALLVAAFAWPSFSSPVTIGNVWRAIEYFGSTLIFILAGLVFGSIVMQYNGTYINATMYGHAILTWILVYCIRTAIVLILYPVLSHMGYGLKVNEAVTMTWGGLKGAVAIALGLVVFNSPINNTGSSDPNNERDKVQFFFLVGSVVFLSALVNASTSPILMQVLRVLSRSSVQKQLLKGVRQRIVKKGETVLEQLTSPGGQFVGVSREEVEYAISSFKDANRKKLLGPRPSILTISASFYDYAKSIVKRKPHPRVLVVVDGVEADRELLSEVRELFLDAVRAAYWEMIADGVLPSNSSATRLLLESADMAKDLTDAGPLCDYKFLNLPKDRESDELAFHERFFDSLDKCLPAWVTIDDHFGKKLHESIRHDAVFTASSFIEAHLLAQERVAAYVGEGDGIDTPEEGIVIRESQAQVELARAYMEVATTRDPHVVDLVNAKKVASIVLTAQDALIEELFRQGICDEHTTTELREEIHVDFERLRKMTHHHIKGKKSQTDVGNPASGRIVDVEARSEP